MMMQMLVAGGLPALTDHEREADDDNPSGYYELEKVKQLADDSSFLANADGKVVKVISMLLYDLPEDRDYKIIFMTRDMNEVLASQTVMLERRDESKAPCTRTSTAPEQARCRAGCFPIVSRRRSSFIRPCPIP